MQYPSAQVHRPVQACTLWISEFQPSLNSTPPTHSMMPTWSDKTYRGWERSLSASQISSQMCQISSVNVVKSFIRVNSSLDCVKSSNKSGQLTFLTAWVFTTWLKTHSACAPTTVDCQNYLSFNVNFSNTRSPSIFLLSYYIDQYITDVWLKIKDKLLMAIFLCQN